MIVMHEMQAAFYETDFRPVPLEEFMKIGNKIHKKNMELVRTIQKEADLGGKDPDHVVELCHEVNVHHLLGAVYPMMYCKLLYYILQGKWVTMTQWLFP
jgi:hypothetical protein